MQLVQLISMKHKLALFLTENGWVWVKKKKSSLKKGHSFAGGSPNFSMNTQIGSLLTKNGWFQLSSQTPSQ